MNKIKKYPYWSLMIICLLLLLSFLFLTNPENVPVGLLVVPVILTFFIVFSVAHLTLRSTGKLASQPAKRGVVALIAGSLVAVVMILQSSGGLSVADLVLMALIMVVTALYVSRY
jgi:hypothetical protein